MSAISPPSHKAKQTRHTFPALCHGNDPRIIKLQNIKRNTNTQHWTSGWRAGNGRTSGGFPVNQAMACCSKEEDTGVNNRTRRV